jgi:Trypsin-like peptidase domain
MPINLAQPSIMSLLIQLRENGQVIATGTGFVAQSQKGPILITNRHNVTGKHQDTGQILHSKGKTPTELEIIHNQAGKLGSWVPRVEPLYAGSAPLWVEHPTLGARVDCVALPLTQTNDVQFYPYDPNNPGTRIPCGPADIVTVVGFPFGLTGGGALALWATGFVASEPAVDFNGLPLFLIDCRSRPGQSGSAVIAYRNGGMVPMENGGAAAFTGPVFRFLGNLQWAHQCAV